MTPDSENSEPTAGDRGVFGNLPSARPGVRSPRRDGGKRDAKPKTPKAKSAKQRPAAKPPPAPARESAPPPPRRPAGEPSPPPPPPRSEATEPSSARGGVEEVAWAGITVAAEAATLGVRLVSRALEAVRERR
jgi:hypothetical protein